MDVRVKREGPRRPDENFLAKLREFNEVQGSPEVAVLWNPESVELEDGRYDPRWEVWIELSDNSHPDHRYVTSEGDIVRDGKTWRFLNTWKYPDGSFLPLDDRFFTAARFADTWRDREHYREYVIKPEQEREEIQRKTVNDIAYGARTRWSHYDVAQVGYGTSGNWRARELWK